MIEHTHLSPKTFNPRWMSVVLGLMLAAVLPGCQFGTLNGHQVSGSNVGRSLTITGYANAASQTMTTYVLDDVTADPYTNGAHWVSIGTTTSSATPYYDGSGTAWYAYTHTVTPVSSGAVSYRWPQGGVVRIKTTQGSSNVYTFDEDFLECAAPYMSDYYDVGVNCYSATSPLVGVVNTDDLSPPAGADYLSFMMPSTSAATLNSEATAYYAAIGAGLGQPRYTLSGWKSANGFPTSETVAYYFNDGDLGFGREMHCRTTTYGTACYVTNYNSVADAISGTSPGATVCMEHRPTAATNKVRFFVYNAAGTRQNTLDINDGGGGKYVPGMCLSCHGGTHDLAANTVTDAHFLPFDIYSFTYSGTAGYTRADQEEAFRLLNNYVYNAGATAPITDLIDGWYGGALTTSGTTVDDTYVPASWSTSSKAESVYNKVVSDYCRTCHVAFDTSKDWDSFAEFEAAAGTIQAYTCDTHYMPHAKRTRDHFWDSGSRAHLLNALKLTTTCD